jgi:hypothetical protein
MPTPTIATTSSVSQRTSRRTAILLMPVMPPPVCAERRPTRPSPPQRFLESFGDECVDRHRRDDGESVEEDLPELIEPKQ